MSYTKFNELLTDNKIAKVKISDSSLVGELKESVNLGPEGSQRPYKNIKVNIGSYDQTFINEMLDKDIEVNFETEKTWVNMLISTLPWIFFIGKENRCMKQLFGDTS